jgi:quercetin dioxygenase-like cupin family protein
MTDKLAQHGVEVVHHFGRDTYIKETRIPAGVKLSQHSHPHAHQSILCSGRALVQTDSESHEYSAPMVMDIPANVSHSVTALTPVVWFCIWPAHIGADETTIDDRILQA